MRLTMFGSGYVGLVDGVCLSDLGNDVICADSDEQKIALLKQGKSPLYEPGLAEKLERNVREGRLSFTSDMKTAITASDILFICVGTPPQPTGEVDMQYVHAVASTIGKYIDSEKIIVDKSTVPVGTAHRVREIIAAELAKHNKSIKFHVVSNPEFLREGAAINDFFNPDRVVVGVEQGDDYAAKTMEKLYRGVARTNRPILVTDVKSAELIKYASNSMLATRISFMNQLSQYCEAIGADITVVAKGMGLDDRIGPRFIQAGIGFGGSCFGKDVHALVHSMRQVDADAGIFEAVLDANQRQKQWVLQKIAKQLGTEGRGRTVALWGLSFKPKTDDIRDAPSCAVVEWLLNHDFKVAAFDPEAMHNYKHEYHEVNYGNTPYDVLSGAHLLVLVTEWDEFRNPDWNRVKQLMSEHRIIDCRNIYLAYREELKQMGFSYQGIGVQNF